MNKLNYWLDEWFQDRTFDDEIDCDSKEII
jgi:hypothetical protein